MCIVGKNLIITRRRFCMQMNALHVWQQIYYFKNFYFCLKICEEIPYQKIFLSNFSTPQGVYIR